MELGLDLGSFLHLFDVVSGDGIVEALIFRALERLRQHRSTLSVLRMAIVQHALGELLGCALIHARPVVVYLLKRIRLHFLHVVVSGGGRRHLQLRLVRLIFLLDLLRRTFDRLLNQVGRRLK